RYARADSLAERVAREALERLAGRMSTPGWMHANPSPFERDGVPGVGWHVTPMELPTPEPVPLGGAGAPLADGDVRVRLVDEGDVGDLYNFCPTDEAPARGPEAMESGAGGTVVVRFRHVTVEVRVERHGDAVVLDLRIRNEAPDHRLRLHVTLH